MRHSIPIILLLVLSGTCTRKSDLTEPALARVGSAVLTVSEARNSIPGQVFKQDSIGAFIKFRDDWIEQQIILQDAYRLRLHRQAKVINQLDRIKEDYLTKIAKDYILAEMSGKLVVTDDEARAYYQNNKDSFLLEERYVKYRHLISSSLINAQRARRDLLRGIEWKEVVDQFSVNPELALRESERFWPESLAVADVSILNRYLKVIGILEISIIEKVGEQYHFVQLLEKRAKGDHPDLEWLIGQIKEWLLLEKKRRQFNTYVKNLYLQAQVNNEIETFNVLSNN